MDWKTATLSSRAPGAEVQLVYLDLPERNPRKWSSITRYTTIIALHGMGMNAAIWKPLSEHLPPSTRLLFYNQRGFRGSSPVVPPSSPGGVNCTTAYLGDLLNFIKYAVEELHVPARSEGGLFRGADGGIVVLAWSKGTYVCVPLLAALRSISDPSSTNPLAKHYASQIPASILPLLSSHLRSVILFEPPIGVLGVRPNKHLIELIGASIKRSKDTNRSPEEDTELTEYFASYTTTPDFPTARPNSFRTMDQELKRRSWDPQVTSHGLEWNTAPKNREANALARLALDPANLQATPPASADHLDLTRLANLPIGLIYGSRTVDNFGPSTEVINEWWREGGGGINGRRTSSKSVQGGNHFACVDHPREFAAKLFEIIQDLDGSRIRRSFTPLNALSKL